MAPKKESQPSKEAKERLLEAGIKIFAQSGFEGASTRMLVKEANVNISAIPYYFGGKDGLYEAVMRHIVATVLKERGETIIELRRALEGTALTQAQAKNLLSGFISSFSEFLLSERASLNMAQIIIREQMRPSPVFEILYEEMMRPMHETFTRLIAFLIGVAPETEDAVLCAYTIMGQILIFKTHKEFVRRRTGWKSYGKTETDVIIKTILQNTDAIIAAHRKRAP